MSDMKQPLVVTVADEPTVVQRRRRGTRSYLCTFFCVMMMFLTLWPREMQMSVRDITFTNTTGVLEKQIVIHNPNIYPRTVSELYVEEYFWDCSKDRCVWSRINDSFIGALSVEGMGSRHITLSNNLAEYNFQLILTFAALCVNSDLMLTYTASSETDIIGQTPVYGVICEY